MKHYEYVKKSEYMPVKKELIKLINLVQDDLRKKLTFRFDFIGSSSRNMITCDFSTNEGYDFDVNIEVNDPDERYSAKELKKLLMESFDKIIDETQGIDDRYGNIYRHCRYESLLHPVNMDSFNNLKYSHCENSTRVFTIKVHESNKAKIKYGCDFAIVNNFIEKKEKKQQYIHFNKSTNPPSYNWQLQEKGYNISKKEQFISKRKLVHELKKVYLNKKNNNMYNKKSRSLYAEAVNEEYNKYQ